MFAEVSQAPRLRRLLVVLTTVCITAGVAVLGFVWAGLLPAVTGSVVAGCFAIGGFLMARSAQKRRAYRANVGVIMSALVAVVSLAWGGIMLSQQLLHPASTATIEVRVDGPAEVRIALAGEQRVEQWNETKTISIETSSRAILVNVIADDGTMRVGCSVSWEGQTPVSQDRDGSAICQSTRR